MGSLNIFLFKSVPMYNNYSIDQWRQERLNNYSQKLLMSKRKALKRLTLFLTIEALVKEFDRIVDRKFWSTNEPGISHVERMKREKKIHKRIESEPIQLNLFS